MRARRVWLRLVTLCLAGSLCALWGAAPASAHSHYIFTGSFGAPGTEAGQLSLFATYGASSGLAVNDETHDVYVADTQNDRVDEFEADGAFVRAWGWGVATGAAEFQTCTMSCQKGLSGSSPGEFEVPLYVAVDNSPGGAGDVYVSDTGDKLVSKFDSEGKLIESWGVKGQFDGSSAPEGPFFEKSTGRGGPRGIAVDTAGNLWVSAEGTNKSPPAGNISLYEFGQGGGFIRVVKPPVTGGIVLNGIALDSFDNVYGDSNTDDIKRYNAAARSAASSKVKRSRATWRRTE